MPSKEYVEVKTPIDEEHSFWSQYRGDSVGRAIHYIYKITGVLRYAENAVFHGDGKITQGQNEPFATVNWNKGYPHFEFENATFNTVQKQLLG